MEKKADASKFSTFSFYRQKKENELDRLASGKKKSSGLFSMFSRGSDDIEQTNIDIEAARSAPTEQTTLMSSIRASITKKATGVRDSISQTIDTGRNLKYFMIFLLIG